jgi:hypothetical protein
MQVLLQPWRFRKFSIPENPSHKTEIFLQICTGTGDAKSKGRCAGAKLKVRSLMDEATPEEALSPAVEASESAVELEQAIQEALQNPAADAKCAGQEVPEKGHVAKSSKGAHLAYNNDGYYTRAAACYIYKRFKESAK